MQIPRHLMKMSVPRTMSLVNKDYKQFKRDGAIKKNHYNLLEMECHQIDHRIAFEKVKLPSDQDI